MSAPARSPPGAVVAAMVMAVMVMAAVVVVGSSVVAPAPSRAAVGARTSSAVVAAGRATTGRCSSWDSSAHSGTLPCLRRGNSSRLVANIRNPATSFWRVSAGSITSSM